MKSDYYEVLGIPKDATIQQIKKKYRSLALKYHPDRVEESEKAKAEEKFKEVSEAYGVLSDPNKRKMYDQYGHAGIDQNFTRDDIFKGADFGDLGDIFSQFFGGGGGSDIFGNRSRSSRPQRGRDIQYEVDITLKEAHRGVEKEISYPRYEHCESCNGNGSKNGTSLSNCETCGGQGAVLTSAGFFRMQQTCSVCSGSGKIIKEHCLDCSGQGMKRVNIKRKIDIPAGVDNSSRLRVQHAGEVGAGGPGDLFLYIHVLDHEVFTRDGNNIYIEQPVSFVKAALGGEESVLTLDGSVSMKVPAGTQSGKVFRLKGKGMPDLRSGVTGDQYVKVMLSVPKKLSSEQKEVLENFAKISGEEVGLKPETIKDKIKKVFK